MFLFFSGPCLSYDRHTADLWVQILPVKSIKQNPTTQLNLSTFLLYIQVDFFVLSRMECSEVSEPPCLYNGHYIICTDTFCLHQILVLVFGSNTRGFVSCFYFTSDSTSRNSGFSFHNQEGLPLYCEFSPLMLPTASGNLFLTIAFLGQWNHFLL